MNIAIASGKGGTGKTSITAAVAALANDKAATQAQRAEKAIPEYCTDGVAEDIRRVWDAVIARVER